MDGENNFENNSLPTEYGAVGIGVPYFHMKKVIRPVADKAAGIKKPRHPRPRTRISLMIM